ncbi:MAG: hypothetical protein KDA65_04530 [Planctomycetaceae bacterium]|nr:hypothetical protein [Planctomycetaceae bacterium]
MKSKTFTARRIAIAVCVLVVFLIGAYFLNSSYKNYRLKQIQILELRETTVTQEKVDELLEVSPNITDVYTEFPTQ